MGTSATGAPASASFSLFCYFQSSLLYLFPEKKAVFRKWGSPSIISVIVLCCFSDCLCCWRHRLPALLVTPKRMWILSATVCLSQSQLDLTWLSSFCMLHGKWKYKKGMFTYLSHLKVAWESLLGVWLWFCLSLDGYRVQDALGLLPWTWCSWFK